MPFHPAKLPFISPSLIVLTYFPANFPFLVLHPVQRLAYQKHMKWEKDWINSLVAKTRKIYTDSGAILDEVQDVMPQTMFNLTGQVCTSLSVETCVPYAASWCQDDDSEDEDNNIFNRLSHFVPSGNTLNMQDELTTFINAPAKLPEGGDVGSGTVAHSLALHLWPWTICPSLVSVALCALVL